MTKKPVGLKDFKIEMVPIGDLIAYAQNPKAHPGSQVDKIASSIKNFGFLVPLVIDAAMKSWRGTADWLQHKNSAWELCRAFAPTT